MSFIIRFFRFLLNGLTICSPHMFPWHHVAHLLIWVFSGFEADCRGIQAEVTIYGFLRSILE
uniref:Uncharacterized protein n=1 Tax=Rhizophora mucronata TaxID=61149 RepID=A0A2P2IH80_RHIMU